MEYTSIEKSIGSLLPNIKRSEGKHSDFEGKQQADYWICETAKLLGEPKGKIFGLTKGWGVVKIMRFFLESEKDNNPRIHWYYLRKLDKQNT